MTGLRRPPLRVWVWTAAAVALVLLATLLWRRSDAAATESTTAPPAGTPTGTPAGAVSEAWSVPADRLPESVVESGRVLIGDEHGIRALDPATGEEAWHYTRANAVLCGLTATDGVAVAVFRTEDRCDEAVALDAGTGVRAWTRNVDFRRDAQLDSTDRIVLATSPTGVVTLDPTGNNIRWRYEPPESCRLQAADAGTAGVAVLQRCAGSADVQLRLLDGFEGDARWSRDLPAADADGIRLLGADRPLGVLVDGEVQLLDGETGGLVRRVPAAEAGTDVQQLTSGTVALLHVGNSLLAFDATSGNPLWNAPALGLPAEPEGGKAGTAMPLMVPEDAGFVHRDLMTGAELGRSEVAGLPGGGLASAVGRTVVYRLTDRVLAYR